MKSRLFNGAAIFSAIVAVATIALWLATCFTVLRDRPVSLTSGTYCDVRNDRRFGSLGRVEFFNDQRGPYRGSIIGFVDSDGTVTPRFDRKVAIGDTLGVYYRYYRFPDGQAFWTLSLSLWHPLLASTVLPVAWLFRFRKRLGLRAAA